MVFGDSRLLISALVASSKPSNIRLCHLIKKIKGIANSFHMISFFHILRTLNQEADKVANLATQLSKGELQLGQVDVRWDPIP